MKIDFVNVADWEGMYVDGVLVQEGHPIAVEDVLAVLNIASDSHWVQDDTELDQWGNRLPKTLAELESHLG